MSDHMEEIYQIQAKHREGLEKAIAEKDALLREAASILEIQQDEAPWNLARRIRESLGGGK